MKVNEERRGSAAPRSRLTADRVLHGAVELADRIGVEPLTIRRLAEHLDVKPMSLYHYVPSKEAILDGMVDLVFAEIDLPPTDLPWKAAMRARCLSARAVLGRHPWATPLMETRTAPGPASLRHHDAVLGCLRAGGLPLALTAHAYAVIDSYVYGFALQEAGLPFVGEDGVDLTELAEQIMQAIPAEQFPNFVEFTVKHALAPGYDFRDSFEFGLDVLLDGIEAQAPRGGPAW